MLCQLSNKIWHNAIAEWLKQTFHLKFIPLGKHIYLYWGSPKQGCRELILEFISNGIMKENKHGRSLLLWYKLLGGIGHGRDWIDNLTLEFKTYLPIHPMAICSAIFQIKSYIISTVNNFFPQLASRAGKTEKLPARIETYQPKTKM